MEFNVFRDYCKAENSEDEDIFNDLQSRLYAEIYYGSNDAISDQNTSNNGVKSELDANNERETRQESNLTISRPPTLSTPALSYENAALNRSKASQKSCTEISDLNSLPKANCPPEAENSPEDSMKKDGSMNLKAEDGNLRSISNEAVEENTVIVGVKKESNSILKKYEFSKPFINKLYREKYDNLTETLKLIQNVNDDENMNERNESKYKVTGKSGCVSKNGQKSVRGEEEIILTSDSDSEDSILEVPIPPKPQPPVINLHDSDIDSEDFECDAKSVKETVANETTLNVSLNENRGGGKSCSKNEKVKKNSKNAKKASESLNNSGKVSSKNLKKGGGAEKSMRNKISNNDSTATATMDLMLNCTDLQRSAGSLNEIRSMSKTLEENVNYERDKNFAEDVMVANFVSPKNRKRKFDASANSANFNGDEGENLLTEKTTEEGSNNDSKRLKSGESWQDYFFKPMSDNLKAFYNESRGQENFNVEEIQSKMSRDPRLWAILDEDLMPDLLKRHKYWNVRCNNCRQPGHQKINCPEPYKSIRCHICGGQGHIETRCPQKMCLTCGKKQGTFRKTCESCRSLYCNMCNAIGHKSTECPDLWRRFHQTTTQINEINVPENLSEVMKPADLLYCCNCTKRGHDSSTCVEFRWSQHFPTPSFVSSYTSGPRYEIPVPQPPSLSQELESRNRSQIMQLENEASNKEDIIPLIKSQKKCMIFRPSALDHIESSRLVYSYGCFYTKLPNGEEIERKLAGEQVQLSHMTNLLKGSISPIFLDELTKLSKFEIKIYYNSNNELMMRVRSKANLTRPIFELFVFWLKLSEDDKRLKIHVNLPRGSKTLLKLLATKLEDLQKDLQDPRLLSGQIKQVRRSLNFGENPERNRNKLLELQWSLMKVFHTKPKSNEHLQRLRKTIRCLKQMQRPEIILENYFSYIVVYNKVFLPRNLTETELQRFLKKYYRTFPEFDAAFDVPMTKKQKKVLLTPYEAFVTNLQQYNNKKNNNPTSTQNSNLIQVQIDENSSKNSEKMAATSTSALASASVAESQQKSMLKVPQYAEKSSRDAEMEKTQKVGPKGFQCPTLSIDNASEKGQKSTQINIGIKIPEIGGQMNPNYANYGPSGISVSSEISVQSVKSNMATDEKQKKTAAKKASKKTGKFDDKAKKIAENFDGLTGKATIIINEALLLNAPYMNRAVDEIRKKMAEKMLKQEHIDTLQRLINLEKEHRNYVSSFCNYLQ